MPARGVTSLILFSERSSFCSWTRSLSGLSSLTWFLGSSSDSRALHFSRPLRSLIFLPLTLRILSLARSSSLKSALGKKRAFWTAASRFLSLNGLAAWRGPAASTAARQRAEVWRVMGNGPRYRGEVTVGGGGGGAWE